MIKVFLGKRLKISFCKRFIYIYIYIYIYILIRYNYHVVLNSVSIAMRVQTYDKGKLIITEKGKLRFLSNMFVRMRSHLFGGE